MFNSYDGRGVKVVMSAMIVMFAGVLGCNEEPLRPLRCSDLAGSTKLPDVPLVYSTEHLDIHVDEDRMFCAGSAQEYERFYQYVGAALGVELPIRTPVFMTDVNGVYCPPGRSGCRTQDGVVFTRPGISFHELAHAATCEWRNGSSNYLNEGIAVAFETTPLKELSPKYRTAPREFMTIAANERFDRYYDEAGHLVRWLLEAYGPEAFRELFETSPRRGGEGVFDALALAYGQDADAVLAEYEASAPYFWVPHRQCADVEILEPVGGRWEFDAVFDCDDPATLGPWEREGINSDIYAPTTMYQSFLLEIETPGSYRFVHEIETEAWIERCIDEVGLSEMQADELWYQDPLFAGFGGHTDLELTPGVYRVDVLRQYADPHPVWMDIVPTPE